MRSYLDVLAGLFASQSVTCNDGRGMDLLLHQLIGVLEQLSRNDDDGSGTIADLLILQIGQFNQDLETKSMKIAFISDGTEALPWRPDAQPRGA